MDNSTNNIHAGPKENVIAGIAGAFLFSLAGAAVYFLLYLLGYLASISGLVGVVCAVKGYEIFSSKLTKKGIVIATVIALAVIVLASYFGLAYDIYDVYKTGFESGETDFSLTFPESVRAVPFFLEEPDIRGAYLSDLLLGLFFCLLGCGSFVMNKMKNTNKKQYTGRLHEEDDDEPEQSEEKAEEKNKEPAAEDPTDTTEKQ